MMGFGFDNDAPTIRRGDRNRRPRGNVRQRLAAALLNATGLPAGYIYLRRWRRAAGTAVIAAVLASLATALNPALHPRLWLAVLGLWIALLVGDGWRCGGKWWPPPLGSHQPARRWPPFAAAGLLLAVEMPGGVLLWNAAERTADRAAAQAHAARYCGGLPTPPDVGSQSAEAQEAVPQALYECGTEHFEKTEYDKAKSLFEELRAEYPKSPLSARAADMITIIRIRTIQGGDSSNLPPPSEAGKAPAGTVTVEITNDSAEDLEILYTGPETGTADLDSSRSTVRLKLDPGTYEVVALAPGADVRPYFGSWTLTSGTAYEESYYIRSYRF
jgi:hypothetical protein